MSGVVRMVPLKLYDEPGQIEMLCDPVKTGSTVKVKVTILGISVSKTARFTIGYLQFPPPTYLAGNAPGSRSWSDSDTTLHLNVGGASARTARNIGTDDIDEAFIVEQTGGDATSATIKVTAFGRSNTYKDVQAISGTFGDGNDSVIIRSSVLIPVTVDGGSDDDVLSYEGANAGTGTGNASSVVLRGDGGGAGSSRLSPS